MAKWFQFWIITWVWESSPHDGCRICSESTTNVIVWQFRRVFGVVQPQYGRVFAQFCNRRSTITHQRPNTSQNSGFPGVNRYQRRPRWVCQPKKSWWRFLVYSRGIIHIGYLQKGKKINSEYYANLMSRFNEDLKKKRPHLAGKKLLSTTTV